MESHKVSRLAYRQYSPPPDDASRRSRHQCDGFAQGQPNLIHEHGNRSSHRQRRPCEVFARPVIHGQQSVGAQLDLAANRGLILTRRKST